MKKVIFSVAVLVFALGSIRAQSIDEIVAKNISAIGGAEKLHAVKSVKTESAIKLQGLEFENLTTILVGKAMRSDSKIMGNDLVQVFDGTTPWAVTPVMMGGSGQPELMTQEMAKSVVGQVDPFQLLDYVNKGTSVELLPAEKVKDKDAYHLKISPKNAAESEIWID